MTFALFFIAVLTAIYRRSTLNNSRLMILGATFLGLVSDGFALVSVVGGALLLALALLVMTPSPTRKRYLSKPLLGKIRNMLPKLSDTEATALESGSVDWDGELFSGQPDWWRLLDARPAQLSDEEQAFIDGPVEALCAMLDDWALVHEDFDLPPAVWDFIKHEGFLGLMIPKEHGGKGFSHTAHSEVVMKISTRSVSAAVTVMVPNSLGPGELLQEYGTEEQKAHYLPRLAKGDEIPCFALTSPVAGSDAGAIPDKGILCHGEWNGEQVLGLRVTWNKRYITLAPVASLIGLAIKVYDPDHLYGDNDLVGVTCVMVPRDLEGVNAGARHLPMNTVFMNGPTWGNDVFIPLDQVIGGPDGLGKGWTMLLECLSIGRSISLPAMGTGAGKLASLATGSYAYAREQFGRSISAFEGVQEALEPLAGHTYQMNAARLLTVGMLDRGVRPAVPSALLKYRNTDLMRQAINHAMDVVAGRGVITGPRNFLARAYQAVPIAITVEGANILTRSLMVFGQGAVRCHPFITEEIAAAQNPNASAGIAQFDRVFYRHLAFTARNALRAPILAWTGGVFEAVPRQGNLTAYYRRLSRFSAAFSLLTDVTLLSVGGGLKARQRLSGRMADALVQLYYSSAVIKFWHDRNYASDQRPIVEWCLQQNLAELQDALRDAIDNFPVKPLRWALRLLVFPPFHRRLRKPDDQLGQQVAAAIVEDTPLRDLLAEGCYRNESPDDPLGRVLNAYKLARQTQPIRDRLHAVIRKQNEDDLDGIALLMGHQRKELVDWAIGEGIVKHEEGEPLLAALNALYDVLRVDAFDAEGMQELAEAARGKRRVVERPPYDDATTPPPLVTPLGEAIDDVAPDPVIEAVNPAEGVEEESEDDSQKSA
ncbi:conserved domain protein [Luminiphilus syltensis NOR5-1B]|uniref:Acyl-coenzyme A dehydrogenase n=1 Tax=Luminiphilus syltensis NOR5-1B TaxID=565045 RepID=B8KWR6_9GAMM|nr:acyl-CoA dehydrogenase [Luminiphilus syltensis]EED35467.1 conserved domain protein [Luminiphilus syltensis NOR5-1B]